MNSAEVQAIAAVAGLFVTIILAGITWKYVRLTKQLADAAIAQMQYQDAAVLSKWRELWSHGKLLGMYLERLPIVAGGSGLDEAIRGITLWDPDDVVRFQSTAAHLGAEVGDRAAIFAACMAYLRQRIVTAKERDITERSLFALATTDEWHGRLKAAREAHEEIMKVIGRRLPATNP